MKVSITSMFGLKRVVLYIIVIAIFLSTIGLISYHYSSQTLYDSIRQSYEDRAVNNSCLLSKVLEEKLMALELIAQDNEIQSMNWDLQKSDLTKYVKVLDVKRFRITDKNGFSKATDGNTMDVSDREYFKKAITGTANISDVLKSKMDNSSIVVCATPIKDNKKKVVGVLSYTVDYKILSSLLSNIKIGRGGYAVLLNFDGVWVAHPKEDITLLGEIAFANAKNDPVYKELASIEKRMRKGETGTGFYHYKGIRKFMAFTPVVGTNWVLALASPESDMFLEIDSLRNKYILGTAILILIALIMSYLIFIYASQKEKVENLQRSAAESYKHLQEITELDKLKTEFIANISHELRTPLTVILSALQLFESYSRGDLDKNPDKIKKHIKTMKQNCFRLLRLINNLIDTTKVEAGFYELKLQYLDIISLIEEITLSVDEHVKINGIFLEFHSDIDEKNIYCDPDKMERILLNLLSNAIKFTKTGGHIRVAIQDIDDNIVISVADTGIGIPADKVDIIFERFRQVNSLMTRENEGSGIGLSLVKSLVEMHDGRICVESEYGKGSKFIIELPVKQNSTDTSNVPINVATDTNRIERVKIEFSDIYNP